MVVQEYPGTVTVTVVYQGTLTYNVGVSGCIGGSSGGYAGTTLAFRITLT